MELTLRCYAYRNRHAQFEAHCIDVNLAVQGDSIDEVRRKLDAMLDSYLDDATGIDREHIDALLRRPSPLAIRLRYHWIKLLTWRDRLIGRVSRHHASEPPPTYVLSDETRHLHAC